MLTSFSKKKRKTSDVTGLSPSKYRSSRKLFVLRGFVIEPDGRVAGILVLVPTRKNVEGYTKLATDAIMSSDANQLKAAGFFMSGARTVSPNENHPLRNIRGYSFLGFLVSSDEDMTCNSFEPLRRVMNEFCDVSIFFCSTTCRCYTIVIC